MKTFPALMMFANNLAAAGATGEIGVVLSRHDFDLVAAELRPVHLAGLAMAEVGGDRIVIGAVSLRVTIEAAEDVELRPAIGCEHPVVHARGAIVDGNVPLLCVNCGEKIGAAAVVRMQ